jgi:DNA repair protein SbcC/Rad50
VRNIQPALTVHIAQFTALLRDRQVVIAVHERALFDYLTLALSPAFLGTEEPHDYHHHYRL